MFKLTAKTYMVIITRQRQHVGAIFGACKLYLQLIYSKYSVKKNQTKKTSVSFKQPCLIFLRHSILADIIVLSVELSLEVGEEQSTMILMLFSLFVKESNKLFSSSSALSCC